MPKRSSVSSRPGRLVSVKAEDILGKPLSRRERAELARLQKRPDSEIDFSDILPLTDIPPLTEEQLATTFQPNRQLITVRLDREVLAWLRSFGPGYSTRINNILRVVMENAVSPSRQPALKRRER